MMSVHVFQGVLWLLINLLVRIFNNKNEFEARALLNIGAKEWINKKF